MCSFAQPQRPCQFRFAAHPASIFVEDHRLQQDDELARRKADRAAASVAETEALAEATDVAVIEWATAANLLA